MREWGGVVGWGGNAEQKQKDEKQTPRKAQSKYRKTSIIHPKRKKAGDGFEGRKVEICSL